MAALIFLVGFSFSPDCKLLYRVTSSLECWRGTPDWRTNCMDMDKVQMQTEQYSAESAEAALT